MHTLCIVNNLHSLAIATLIRVIKYDWFIPLFLISNIHSHTLIRTRMLSTHTQHIHHILTYIHTHTLIHMHTYAHALIRQIHAFTHTFRFV